MTIEYWSYSGVRTDGTMENDPGAVVVEPGMDTSGLHHPRTGSAKSDGLWLGVCTGRLKDGTMHGITLYFDDDREMRQFEQTRKAKGELE
jgi:hypothetical protein